MRAYTNLGDGMVENGELAKGCLGCGMGGVANTTIYGQEAKEQATARPYIILQSKPKRH